MKKFISFLLVATMVFAMGTSVFAAEPQQPYTYTIVDIQNQHVLRDALVQYDRVRLDKGYEASRLGIWGDFEIPRNTTLIVDTTLNVHGNLTINGTLIVYDRVNNQGYGTTITVGERGSLAVRGGGHVENVAGSTFINNGTLINDGYFKVRNFAFYCLCNAQFYVAPVIRPNAIPICEHNNIVDVQNQNVLRNYLSRFDVVILRTSGRNLGVFHDDFVVPANTTLIVETPLNVHGNLTIYGNLVVAEGGRINNQRSGSINIARHGVLYVRTGALLETVTGSTVSNNGIVRNSGTIQLRAGVHTNLTPLCVTGVGNNGILNINRGVLPLN